MAIAEPYVESLTFRSRWSHLSSRTPLPSKIVFAAGGVLVLVVLFGPFVAPYNPLVPAGAPETGPSLHNLFGTDEVGRDVLSRVLYGMRSTGLGAAVVIAWGVVFGGLIGLISGAAGGIIDLVLTRFTEVFLALPGPVLAIALVAALGQSYVHTLIGVAIVWWPLYARVVRAEVRRLKASPHLEAARLGGVGRIRIGLRHLLPGAVPSIIVTASLDVSALVLTLAGLSFLGLGQPAPAPELGSMAAEGVQYVFQSWWVAVMPAAAVALIAVIASFVGDALRDQFDDR